MPSSVNTQTQAISGYGLDKSLPDGVAVNNTTIGTTTPVAGAFTTITATTVTTTGGVINTVTAGSTAAVLSNNGIATFGSESTAAVTYTLTAPVAGVRKTLISSAGDTLGRIVYTGSSLVSIGATTATSSVTRLTFPASSAAVDLVGLSTTKWAIVSNVGSVTTSS